MNTFGHVLTAMVTPFCADGSVDFEGAITLANYLLENGSDGIVVCGTTGESPTITAEEKIRLFETIAKNCSQKGTIIANTGTYNTAHSVEMTKNVSHIPGISGVMAVVPYYNKPNQEGCFQHYKAIAEATHLPVIVYNVPGRTSSSITPQTLLRLVRECSNIRALKDAAGNPAQTAEVAAMMPEGFMIYSGDDGMTLPMLAVGGCGVISVVSHVVGKEIKQMILAYESGNVKEAMRIHHSLVDIFKGMFITTNPIPIKTAVRLMGLPSGGFRLPMVDATEEEVRIIKSLLHAYGKI